MNNLFEQLGKLAQQATGGNPTDMLGKLKDGLSGGTGGTGGVSGASGFGNFGNLGGAASDALGKLKSNVPSGMGGVGGLLGAGALGGILGVLMGGKGIGKTVSKVGQGVLMAGGTAAAAGLAWTLYQKWSQTRTDAGSTGNTGGFSPNAAQDTMPSTTNASPQTALPSAQRDPAGMLVLEAMVFAARADGHLDEQERRAIHETMTALFPGTDVATCIESLLNCPLNPDDLARRVQNREQASDVYRLSRLVIDVNHPMERAYLESLALAFGFSDTERRTLDDEVEVMRQQ